jgi:hypothetical protein
VNGDAGVWWVETKDAANILKYSEQVPENNEFSNPKYYSATVEKPGIGVKAQHFLWCIPDIYLG